MKKVVKYVSIRGPSFDTPEEAMKHEDGLPSIIETYKNDLKRLKVGGQFGGRTVTEFDIAKWKNAVAGYEADWAFVQNQRKEMQSGKLWQLSQHDEFTQEMEAQGE